MMGSTPVPDEFDPTIRVAEGITVLEASAGTGKTHAVASLVVHEVAEGRPIDELLVVTFTRKATGTLRERVWQQLTEAVQALAPGAPEPADALLSHLREGGPDLVDARRTRLRHALSNFDAATIATTHGFCQQVLAGLGVAGDAERDLELLESVDDLVTDAVDDLFVRRFHDGRQVLFDRKVALAIARVVIANPDCAIAPVDDNPVDRLRFNFATSLRKRIVEQKRRGRLITYDDLLSRLDASINEEHRGPLVAGRLRSRFTMAVVDEFQDTDTVQWRILRRAFGDPPCRLVLVGDPKQAIYAFRGGDVFAYLEATRDARHRLRLPVSWRADQGLLDAQNAFFAGAQLGDEEIRHHQVRGRPGAPEQSVTGPGVVAALTVRIADRATAGLALTKNGWVTKPAARRFIAEDLAATAVRLLAAGSMIGDRPVGPEDIAVLTRTRTAAAAARDALQAVGVRAVVHTSTSVLETTAAEHWLGLLRALERPASVPRVHAVAIGPFVGWNATRLAAATDRDWEEVDGALHDWATALRTHAAAGLLRSIEATNGLTARLRGQVGGERRLSDIRHVAELLDARQSAQPASIGALAGWLAEEIAQPGEPGRDQARRRLESDADAIAIHTVHGAKGLEFPIVLLPSLWDTPWVDDDEIPVFHDGDGNRAVGVGEFGELHDWQVARANEERDQEDLRLLYVALTRAKHQVVGWWATTFDADRSAFARILCGTDQATGAVERRLPAPADEATIAGELTRRGITVETASGPDGQRHHPAPARSAPLRVAPYDRTFDHCWVRTSYSGLTRAAHDLGSPAAPAAIETVEVDEHAKVDEPDVSAHPTPAEGPLAIPLPLGGMPGGARVGTLVHEALENVDFAAADLEAELSTATLEAGARRILPDHVATLGSGLALALQTPLGPGWDDGRLCDLGRGDRLDELNFDLPLAGGDHPARAAVTMDAIAEVFATLPKGDPLAGYHERLRNPLLAATVRGFLNGSIDLAARLGSRHIVVDYKTNVLAPPGTSPVAWHYRPAALADAMQEAHYPLQAALYAVALHRFLRWRQHGYDPATHLGGISYLFLRGMTGPDGPTVEGKPCGVFSWHPSADFVTTLSDLLDRGAVETGTRR